MAPRHQLEARTVLLQLQDDARHPWHHRRIEGRGTISCVCVIPRRGFPEILRMLFWLGFGHAAYGVTGEFHILKSHWVNNKKGLLRSPYLWQPPETKHKHIQESNPGCQYMKARGHTNSLTSTSSLSSLQMFVLSVLSPTVSFSPSPC